MRLFAKYMPVNRIQSMSALKHIQASVRLLGHF